MPETHLMTCQNHATIQHVVPRISVHVRNLCVPHPSPLLLLLFLLLLLLLSLLPAGLLPSRKYRLRS
jgi:hypothetical protein